jgi:DNA polymerase III subunit delta'
MNFEKVVGQGRIKSVLKKIGTSNRIPHALLLIGPAGSGALQLGLSFSQLILCKNNQNGEACLNCPNCTKVEKFIHPDVHYSFPTIGAKEISTHFLSQWRSILTEKEYFSYEDWLDKLNAENKQGNITKEECNDIISKLSLKSFESDKKILIMWLPELLGKEGNSLLKIIEEPPENTVFILVTEQPDKILNTIKSRTQILQFGGVDDDDITKYLIQKDANEDTAKNISHLCEGNIVVANNLLKDLAEQNNSIMFLEWMRNCYSGDGLKILAWVEKFAALGREKQKILLTYGHHVLREIQMLIVDAHYNVRLTPNEHTVALNISKVLNFEKLESINNLMNDCIFGIERNGNPKTILLDVSLKLHSIFLSKI